MSLFFVPISYILTSYFTAVQNVGIGWFKTCASDENYANFGQKLRQLRTKTTPIFWEVDFFEYQDCFPYEKSVFIGFKMISLRTKTTPTWRENYVNFGRKLRQLLGKWIS